MSLRVIWQYMDRSVTKKNIWTSEASVHIIFFGDGPVHILPYDPQCHELFAISFRSIWIHSRFFVGLVLLNP